MSVESTEAPLHPARRGARERLTRAFLVGVAVGGGVALLDVATVRMAYAAPRERAALALGVSALLVSAVAGIALWLALVDEGGRAWEARGRRGARTVALMASTAAWWIPVAVGLGRSRVIVARLGGAAWLGATLSVMVTATVMAGVAVMARAVLSSLARSRVGRRRAMVVALALALAVAASLGDAYGWRRLHPELHAGLLGVELALLLFAGFAAVAGSPTGVPRWRVIAWAAVACALAPLAPRALRSSENVWFIAHYQSAAARQVLALASRAASLLRSDPPTELPRRFPRRRGFPSVAGKAAEVPALSATSPPPPVSPDAHLILITVDALRPDHVGAYGYRRTVTAGGDAHAPISPNLDQLAARSVRFARAYTQAPHSAYSIASLLTSEYIHSTVHLGLPPPPTLAELLSARGWRTEAYFPMGLFFNGREDLRAFAERRFGFDRATTWDLDARELTDHVLRRLDEIRRDGEPRTFLWIHYFDVHEPYLRHAEFGLGSDPMSRYDSEIAFFDRELGRLLAALGQLDRPSVIALTADHGEEFKEHGGWYHGSSVYEEQVRVPLLLCAPGLPPRVVHGPVELVDVAPTLMEMLGEAAPESERGDDLAPVLVGEAEPTRPVYSEVDTRRMVTDERWKLIHDVRRDTWELYDLVADPRELVNVYDRERAQAERLDGEMRAWIAGLTAGQRDAEPPPIVRARLGDKRAVPELATLLVDERQSAVRRAQAARLIGALEGYAGDPALRQVVADGATPPVVKAEAALAMGELTDRRGAATLAALLDDPIYRRRAAVMLGRLRDPRAASGLIEAMGDPDLELRKTAIHYLGFVGDGRAVQPLLAAADELRTRYLVGLALARIGARTGDARVLPFLLERLARETYEDNRAYLVCALGLLGDPGGLEAARHAALASPPVKWASETLVRLGGLPRGAIAGVDFAPEGIGLDGGYHHCRRRPPPPGGESTDDYAGATLCEQDAPTGTIHFALARSVDAEIVLRIQPASGTGTRAVLIVNGKSLPPVALDPGWHELHIEAPASLWKVGRNDMELRLQSDAVAASPHAGAFAEVDHLLVIPR